jgi:hypothetical protein
VAAAILMNYLIEFEIFGKARYYYYQTTTFLQFQIELFLMLFLKNYFGIVGHTVPGNGLDPTIAAADIVTVCIISIVQVNHHFEKCQHIIAD